MKIKKVCWRISKFSFYKDWSKWHTKRHLCVICLKILAWNLTNLNDILRHFRSIFTFELKSDQWQKSNIKKALSVIGKASYKVTYKIARCKKFHHQQGITYSAIDIVETMPEGNYAKQLQCILLNDTIARWMNVISEDTAATFIWLCNNFFNLAWWGN